MLNGRNGENRAFPVRLYVSDLSYDDVFYDRWYSLMPEGRARRCDRFRNESDRQRCICAYALLVHSVTDLYDREDISGKLDISETGDGKPYFKNIPVCFNISHSKERVAVALSPEKVGCDVECKSRGALAIAKRFFTAEEYSFLEGIPEGKDRDQEFTGLWTLKESVVKCLGEGIRRELNDFCLVDESGNRKRSIKLADSDEIFYLREYDSENEYCYSICSTYDDIEDSVRRVVLK